MSAVLSLINHRNISTIIHLKLYSPGTIYMLHSGNQEDKDDLNDLREFMGLAYPEVSLVARKVNMYSCEELKKTLDAILSEESKLTLDLSNGNPVAAMILHHLSNDKNLNVFVYSERDDRAAILHKGKCSNVDMKRVDLEISDFIKSGGGDVLASSTKTFMSEEIEKLLMWQIQNHDKWMRTNKTFKTKNIIRGSGSGFQENMVGLELKGLTNGEKKGVLEFIYFLHESRIAKMKKTGRDVYTLDFRQSHYKQLLMVHGNWLEALTFHAMKHLNRMDDLESGVTFYWDEKLRKVANEIDVMAVYKGKLVAVSCKDTSKYNVKELNELEVAANRLGGENSIKILVSTFWPDKNLVMARAREMGIHIIRYDGNLEKFVKAMQDIFDKAE